MVSLNTVSIVIPSYNQGIFLERTIDSILRNQVSAEIIVMDGGSTDCTIDILRRRESDLKLWKSEKDHGQADAVNKALRVARGDIVGWINSDDLYLPGAIDRVLAEFKRRPEVDVIHGNRLLIDEEDGVIGWSCSGAFDPERRGFNVNSETAFWRRTRVSGLELNANLRFAMDLEWFSRLYIKGLRFQYIPTFIGALRCHSKSKSSTISKVGREETIREWKRLFGNECWQVRPPSGRFTHISESFLNPKDCLFPYLYRRIWQGRRGLSFRNDQHS